MGADGCHETADDLSRARGFRHLDTGGIAKLPVEDVIVRVEANPAPANLPDAHDAAAPLSTAPEPRVTVIKALEIYGTLAKEKTLRKSVDQLRRWQPSGKKAIDNFAAVVGDKEIANVSCDDMLGFRQRWLD